MNESLTQSRPRRSVEIVVPVYNEAHVLADSISRLHAYLARSFPFPFTITVADNASTDDTWKVAIELAQQYPRVQVLHLDQKGRGRALKYAWARSDADVVAYMDVDLSTGLDGLLPLVAPLLSGHSDLAIGSRLRHDSAVVRGPKREFISRSYNLLLRIGLAAKFSDAQCGFKAVRTEVFRAMAPHLEDDAWFFDTELLVLAQRNGLRIHEVAVDWVDDPDSRVDIVRTALDDLKGMARMAKRSMTGRIAIPELSRRPIRTRLRGLGRRWQAPGSAALAAISAVAVVALTFKAGG